MAFFGQLFDSKTSILGTLGGHFGTLWLHFGGLGLHRGPQGTPLRSKVDLGWIWGGFAPLLGSHFGYIFVKILKNIELQKRSL